MSAVEMELTSRLSQPEEACKFSRQHLANSLWALATLERLPSGRLLTALAGAMQERASDCNPQEISNTVWAFAKLGRYSIMQWLNLLMQFVMTSSIQRACFVPASDMCASVMILLQKQVDILIKMRQHVLQKRHQVP